MAESKVDLKSITQLRSISEEIIVDLKSSSHRIPKLIGYQVYLMEVFSYEIKKLNRISYCDYEIAFVSYYVTVALLNLCSSLEKGEMKDLIEELKKAVIKKKPDFLKIENAIIENQKIFSEEHGEETGDDLLMDRFKKLKMGVPTKAGTFYNKDRNTINLARVAMEEYISPVDLFKLLFEDGSKNVLLIDFRKRKEFDYNHIKYSEIVNIDPEWVSSLLQLNSEATDADLEDKLKNLLLELQFNRMKKRYSYDLIVVYNLSFGPKGRSSNRFNALKELLINADNDGLPLRSPFRILIDILMYKNRYISSRLKRYPCILMGGVKNWFDIYGSAYIEKSQISLTRPSSSLSRGAAGSTYYSNSYNSPSLDLHNGSNSTGSPYLKSFRDYLSTAKSSLPVPNGNILAPASPVSSLRSDWMYKKGTVSESKIDLPGEMSRSQSPQQQPPASALKRRNSASVFIPTALSAKSSSAKVSKSSDLNRKATSKSGNSKSSATLEKFLEDFSTGLTNLGNSCYMNCVIQCLAATLQLTQFFFTPDSIPSLSGSGGSSTHSYRQHINVNNILGSKGVLTTNYVALLLNMFANSGKYYTPSQFKKVIGSLSPDKKFASFDQQDCVEFLNFMLDGLHEDLNQMQVRNSEEKKQILELTPEQEKAREFLPLRLASTIEWERYLKLNFSIIVDYFQGQFASSLKCLECGNTSTTFNAFLILSLPIPERLGSAKDILLYDCLEEFTTTELLDDSNKWHCPECKKFTRLTKKITVTRLPQILIINFTRFEINSSGYFNKLNTFIKYPVGEVLDLTKYWPQVGTQPEANISPGHAMSSEKEEQILETLPTRNQIPPFRYKLYGVINHYGNLTTGHYTSYVYKNNRSKSPKGWCYFDDSKVTFNCKDSQVLNSNAYCLFYYRI